ncbi:MAG: deoxyribodipyrimidine photo-lyase, partial [Akkermansiaceae bacterium]
MTRALVWFRRDLRLKDNPALAAAAESGAEILPVYIHGLEQSPQLSEGGASKWWLHHALEDLDSELGNSGGKLHLAQGESVEEVLLGLIGEYEIDAVYWNRRYQPEAIELDSSIKKQLQADGIKVHSFNASALNEPHAIENKSGKPYQVFTPYWKLCRDIAVDKPRDADLSNT